MILIQQSQPSGITTPPVFSRYTLSFACPRMGYLAVDDPARRLRPAPHPARLDPPFSWPISNQLTAGLLRKLFAVIVFSKGRDSAEDLDNFKSLAQDGKAAVRSLEARKVFAGAA